MRDHRGLASVLVVVLVLVLAACTATTTGTPPQGSSPGSGSTPGSSAPAVDTPLVAPVPAPTDPPGLHRFDVYWMRDCPGPEVATDVTGCRLAVGASRTTDRDDVPRAAVDALLAGPDPTEVGVHLGSNIRKAATLNSLKVEGDLATIDFNRYFETAKTRPQTAQVVYLLTQFPGIARVQILVDGITNGAVGANPLTRADVAEFDPPLLVESPTLGATVPHRFKATGTAVSPDGQVHYRVEAPDGTKLVEGVAPVLGPVGRPGPIVVPITIPDAVTGPVLLLVFEAGDRGPATEVTTPARLPLVVA